jgi:hypothetical protein
MRDAKIIKKLLEEAKSEVEKWPRSMKNQEPGNLRLTWHRPLEDERDDYEEPAEKVG